LIDYLIDVFHAYTGWEKVKYYNKAIEQWGRTTNIVRNQLLHKTITLKNGIPMVISLNS
jgi:hypothetical protein